MESDDLTVRVLVEIRDELRGTNRRLDTTNERLQQVETRLDRVETRIVACEIRTATAITDMHGTLNDIHGLLKGQLDLRDRVERCEREIDELKKRVN